jgi:NADH dehydrogenase
MESNTPEKSELTKLTVMRAEVLEEIILPKARLSSTSARKGTVGGEGILINDIAWALRDLPVFGVFGSGDYRVQPIYGDDLAELAVPQGESAQRRLSTPLGRDIQVPRAGP